MSAGHIVAAEKALKELIKDWERFFSGIRKTPPQLERDRLSRRLRRLAEAHQDEPAHADRFRIEQLQNRFMSYSQLWERLLREREEGRGRSIGVLRAAAAADAQVESEPNAAETGSVDSGDGALAGLFDQYAAAKQSLGQPIGVDAVSFAAQVEAQREQLEQKFGLGVRFEVVVEGDKVKLAARKDSARRGGE
jgi:hypothetical protein